jgi:tetratricopeptide (TPR) repeat protein
MSSTRDPAILAEEAKREFGIGNYPAALEKFRQAADRYTELGDAANHAEQMNNVGVTLLQMGKAREALDAVDGTESVFAAAGDVRRQGIALNNQAAARDALGELDAATELYGRAARMLGDAGERGMQSEALKAAAAIDLRRGRIASASAGMLGSLVSNPKPNLLERVLKALLRRVG